jgi:hypothetical protein
VFCTNQAHIDLPDADEAARRIAFRLGNVKVRALCRHCCEILQVITSVLASSEGINAFATQIGSAD